MTKEEIALQLTLARIGKLKNVAGSDSYEAAKDFNQTVADETAKLFNSIFHGIDLVSRD